MSSELFDEAVAHTLAKHQILQEYLKGWLPILAQGQGNRLLYFDGFAGCGELAGSYPGSPLVAIRTAIQAVPALNVPLDVKMVEKDSDRCNYLRTVAQKERIELGELAGRIRIDDPVCGECEDVVTDLLAEYARTHRRLGPALFFLDQYGYAGLCRKHLLSPLCGANPDSYYL